MCCILIEKNIIHLNKMTYMATPWHQNLSPGDHEIYNFGRPFLGHHYYIPSLSDLSLGVEKKIFKEIMYFHYMTYTATPYRKNPCPRNHERYNFCKHFLGHDHYILSLSDLCLGVKKKNFEELMYFHYLTSRPCPSTRTPAPESWKLQFL